MTPQATAGEGCRKRKLSGWHLSVGARVLGYYSSISFYPLGSWRRFLLIAAGQNTMTPGWHLMFGPIHAHGYYLGPKLIELEIDVSHDPFWGTVIRVPPSYRVLLGHVPAQTPPPPAASPCSFEGEL